MASHPNLHMEAYLRRYVAIFIGCSIIFFISIDMAIATIQNHPPIAYLIEQWDLSRIITLIIATVIFSVIFRRGYEKNSRNNTVKSQ